MRERRTEDCHDSITHRLVHRSFVAMNGLHHSREDRVKELPGVLNVLTSQQLE
jgi:hypothetical protein